METNFFSKESLFNFEDKLMRESGKVPLYVDIHPSGICNQHCRWCIGVNKGLSSDFLSRTVMMRVVDEAKDMGVKCLVFDGFYGDPLMNPNTIDVMDKAIGLGMSVGLGTNGSLIGLGDDVLINLTYIRISLDSCRNDVYNLLKNTEGKQADHIINNVKNLLSLKKRKNKSVRVGLSFLLQPETANDIEGAVLLGKSMGVDHIQFKIDLCNNDLSLSRIQESIDRSRKHSDMSFSVFSDIFITKPRYKKCFIPYLIPVIGSDGQVYTCCECSDRQDRSYGNVYQQSLQDIWRGQRKKKVADSINGEECEVCSRHNWRINNFVNEKDQYRNQLIS